MKNELEELIECYSTQELDESWYYIVLKYLNNKANEIDKKKSIIKIDEENLESLELENIKESISLVDSNLLLDWLKFILKYKNNLYFSNIINKTIYIAKQIIENDFVDEALINKLGFSSFELTISQNIINKFFIKKINLFNINSKETNIIKMI